MKVFAILALAITAVSAQAACKALVSNVPACGETCISQAAATNGCPTVGDIACRCSKMAAIQGPAVSCVAKTCPADAAKIQSAAEAVCACVKKGGA